MKNHKTIILTGFLALAITAAALLFSSCGDDCPTCPGQPKPYKGWLYATDFEHEWVYKIDTETDSLVDSMQYVLGESYKPSMINVSSDGKYLSVGCNNTFLTDPLTIIFDAQTLEEIIRFNLIYWPIFIPEDNLFIGFGGDSIHIYSLPSFTRLHEEPSLMPGRAIARSDQGRIYYCASGVSGHYDSVFIGVYDYINRELLDQWYFRDSKDSLAAIYEFDIHPDGRYLYCFTGSKNDGVKIIGYDLMNEEIIFRTSFSCTNGSLKVCPDGSELYATDPGYFSQMDIPGIVFVFDTETGRYIDGISLYGQEDYPYSALYATMIAFTPTGEKAYVGSGRLEKASGTISVIDTKEKKIIKNIWPDMRHFIGVLCIGPKR